MAQPVIDQGELFEIPNPCQGICVSNNRGYCKGCLRSRQERFHWHELSPFQKQQVVNLCEKRRLKILAIQQEKQQASNLDTDEQSTPQTDLFPDQSPKVVQNTIDPEQLPAPSSRQGPPDDSQINLFDSPSDQ